MKLPITLFFKAATILIYVLAFKILGVSIHSLQVSQVLKTHTSASALDDVSSEYREYAIGEIEEFVKATEEFTTAVTSGDKQ